MSRINTNVSSLIAQNTLVRSNNDLNQSLVRLSTGLRINSGADDPAGLIASESLRRDITAVTRAISNSERAGQLISTADSALGQVSNLLNDIRGLISEAANTGVLSAEQIAANQLQVDSSLEAIDRIAQTTTFQSRRILDGSLGFTVSGGTGYSTASNLQIDQANLGAVGSVAVAVDITSGATQAQITNAVPATALGELTIGGQSFTLRTDAASSVTSAVVDVEVNAGPDATGRFEIQGYEFKATATGTADDDIDLVVSQNGAGFNHGATKAVVFDDTTITIQADAATLFDNTTVAVTKSALGGTVRSSNVIISEDDAGGGAEINFDLVATAASAADVASINIVIATGTPLASGDVLANFTTADNTLTITLDTANAAITQGEIDAALDIASLNGAPQGANALFTSSGFGGAATIDGGGADVDLDSLSDTSLEYNRADATYSAVTNTLTLDLNSDLAQTTASQIKAAIDGISPQFNDGGTSISGPENIDIADVTASGTYDTLTRSTVLATYATDDLTLSFDSQSSAIALTDVVSAIDGLSEFSGTVSTSTTGTINGSLIAAGPTTTTDVIERLTTGVAAFFNTTTNRLTLTFDGLDATINNTDVVTAINGLTDFSGSTTTNVLGSIDGTTLTAATGIATAGQVQDLVVRVAGELGSEVFTFQAGATFQQIADAIQLVSDAIGVTAAVAGSSLTLTSSTYGSSGFIDVEVISEGTGGTFESNLSAARTTGTDIVAQVNGVLANGDGNELSINTATLDLSLTVADSSSTDVNFTINGGGAVFQLGPEVVSNQQAQIGVGSIATGSLGGTNGRLYELRSGNAKALATDATGAQRVVDEAITTVVELRGRLGAFQKTTIDTNVASLQDTLVNLTDAESQIRDTDFAQESAALTRAQILVQAGTSVLAIANSNPQNVLALLR